MRITAIQAEQRQRRIYLIIETLHKCFAENIPINKNRLLSEVCFKQNVSRRTALEYLEIALGQVDHKIEKIDGEVCIIKIPDERFPPLP